MPNGRGQGFASSRCFCEGHSLLFKVSWGGGDEGDGASASRASPPDVGLARWPQLGPGATVKLERQSS